MEKPYTIEANNNNLTELENKEIDWKKSYSRAVFFVTKKILLSDAALIST